VFIPPPNNKLECAMFCLKVAPNIKVHFKQIQLITLATVFSSVVLSAEAAISINEIQALSIVCAGVFFTLIDC